MGEMTQRINYYASLRFVAHDMRLTRANLSAQIERIDRAELELESLIRSGPPDDGNTRFDSSEFPVVHNLDIKERANGSIVVVIDGGGGNLTLPPSLAGVFQFLASAEKERGGNDPLIGWRSRSVIKEFLEKQVVGKPYRLSFVNNVVFQLRNALRKAGYDRALIQTHRRKGVRLAYKGVPWVP
jgi:hypothetical protein